MGQVRSWRLLTPAFINVAPGKMAELCRLALAGERSAATAVNDSLSPLNAALFVEANPIPVKWALALRGLIEEGIRLPLTPLDESFYDQVKSALEVAGV